MAKRNEMLAKLKAAALRRERRVATMPQVTPASGQSRKPSVDVVGAIVSVILAHGRAPDCRLDAVVVSALRAQLKQIPPQRAEAEGLYARLETLQETLTREHAGFSLRQFRDAMEQLLDEAQPYETGNAHSTRFIEFLEVLGQ